MQDALKENSIDITEENLMQLKYDPASVWGYVEVKHTWSPFVSQTNLARFCFVFPIASDAQILSSMNPIHRVVFLKSGDMIVEC